MSRPGVIMGMVTAPVSAAKPLARALVKERLVACVNVVQGG